MKTLSGSIKARIPITKGMTINIIRITILILFLSLNQFSDDFTFSSPCSALASGGSSKIPNKPTRQVTPIQVKNVANRKYSIKDATTSVPFIYKG